MVAFAAANAILHLSVHKDWIALLQFLFLNLLHNLLLTLNLQLDRCCTSGIVNERVPVQNIFQPKNIALFSSIFMP